MKIDCHNHAEFSPDSSQNITQLAKRAIEKGICYLAVTEHMDLGFPLDKCPEGELIFDYLVTAKYFDEIKKARALVGDKIEIIAGIEAGYTPNDVELTAKKLSEFPFEYVINSVHICHDYDCYWAGYFDGLTKKDAYAEYLQAVRDSLDVPYAYDAVGHIGYISRPAPYNDKALTYGEFAEMLDDILGVIIRKEKILEVNSSTGGCGGLFLPDVSIVRRYYELGGRLINFGSDSHSAERAGDKYDEVAEIVKNIGFKAWAVKRNGKIVMEGID